MGAAGLPVSYSKYITTFPAILRNVQAISAIILYGTNGVLLVEELVSEDSPLTTGKKIVAVGTGAGNADSFSLAAAIRVPGGNAYLSVASGAVTAATVVFQGEASKDNVSYAYR